MPAHAELLPSIDLWSGEAPPRRRRPGKANAELASTLVRTLIGWNGNHQALVDALVWCRRNPDGVRPAFRSRRGWEQFLRALQEVLDEDNDGSARAPELDTVEAATLYQTLYWVARTASTPTPETDLLHVTCAGWASLPALVHKALHGTPHPPHRARRLRARELPRGGPQPVRARPALRVDAAGAEASRSRPTPPPT